MNGILSEIKGCVLVGGTGFIGSHLTQFLLANSNIENICLADIRPPAREMRTQALQDAVNDGRVHFCQVDIRKPLEHPDFPTHADLIVNLAAVHREPGHKPHEYFETNLNGAEHVCAWAEAVGCNRIIFTSSIAPYGPTEEAKDESSLPAPMTPYGASKLAAEKMHMIWQAADTTNRRLLIVRPGVVFGSGEGGNVTRLVHAVLGRYFFYMGNRHTRKAGGYVKELCHALMWVLNEQEKCGIGVTLFNFTMDPAPSVEEYVNAICRIADVKRFIPSVPYSLLYMVSCLIEAFARPVGIRHPFSPVRIRKLVRSNNIVPGYLQRHGYTYKFTLEQALDDWKKERPQDWA